MFKFSFGNTEGGTDEEDSVLDQDNMDWYECRKVQVPSDVSDKLRNVNERHVMKFTYEGNMNLSCLSPAYVVHNIKNSGMTCDLLEAEKNQSDLIPGKYEGGLKIWECTHDLVNYLSDINSFKGKNILDLGCGSGMLGIMTLMKGAFVTFQDYNSEVIELNTIPNIFLNTNSLDNVEFYSGDWASFFNVISQGKKCDVLDEIEPAQKKAKETDYKFDYILSSETIYNLANYGKISDIITGLLKDDGTCYVAAKKCYFGVGGSIQIFTDYLKGKGLSVETCWSSKKGVAREILEIKFVNQ